jgi:ADP-ribose pyrophosphatase YjhB (NUDIX family)
MTVTEQSVWAGRVLSVTWEDAPGQPPRERTTQASGVCFTEDGRIVLVRGGAGGAWSLPGGHPEEGETTRDALIREVFEEASAVVEACEYLGAHKVDDPAEPDPYYQTRWWARVRLLPFTPEYETTERCLIRPEDFVSALAWDTTAIARALLNAALAADRRSRSTL